MYPEIEPLETGMLDVGDGQHIYWEVSGNRDGKPVVFLHGGPGGGTTPTHRRLFDPERYRIVLFDQRGCGLSIPHASEPDADLSTNTTWHLIADMERLRGHLGIDRWQVFGGSWGSALALAYAETHPERVTELVLRGIFTLRREELDWFYEGGVSAIFPDLWQDFLAPIPLADRAHLIEAYGRLLDDPNPSVYQDAAIAWARWESSTITLLPQIETVARFTSPEYATAFARIENHYFRHGGWWADGQLIRDVGRIRHIPAVIVQGRYDMCTPMMTAWALHEAWPEAEFEIVPDAGHAFDEPGILDALVSATDRFAEGWTAGEPSHRERFGSEDEAAGEEPGDEGRADAAGEDAGASADAEGDDAGDDGGSDDADAEGGAGAADAGSDDAGDADEAGSDDDADEELADLERADFAAEEEPGDGDAVTDSGDAADDADAEPRE